jgi:hypothetical protein
MEPANYELVRYPSGQLVLTRVGVTGEGTPSSGPRDIVGVYASEAEAQHVLARLVGGAVQLATKSSRAA